MINMALHSKKLHVRKAGVVTDINLYTTLSEAGNSALAIRDEGTTAYAKLGTATDALASPLRVRKNGETYAVLKSAAKPGIAPLFAFTIDRYNDYLTMFLGAIYGDRTASPTTYTITSDKFNGTTGGIFVSSFLGTTNSNKLLLTGYSSKVIDPFASSWTTYSSIAASLSGCKIAVPCVMWLYVTGDTQIHVLNMNNSFAQSRTYPLIGFPAITIPSGATAVCDALILDSVTTSQRYLYAIFNARENEYDYCLNSFLVKLLVNPFTGGLTYMAHIEVVKGANTLKLFDNKLYVCCGGNLYDDTTCLQIIDTADFTTATVPTTIHKIASMTNGYFRDVTIVDNNYVYVIIGKQDGYYNYASVYYTSIANITNPILWIKVMDTSFNTTANFWGVYNDSGRLWVVAGNRVHVFDSLPIGSTSPAKIISSGDIIRSFAQII